ncbi:hypothetical protein M011DRAFT_406490 [Sporormia fimetaria CBS 119925]|uniref:Uncharacterized protein n=1 Tax=Sporormia fimetaria CBS 119925 TaxID=1340428 RepID=A0A6A6V704_9PLEO|nr:hypothetical protein M011DRAFT_406490 [Sporormia fimetaria CBS 119925]
MQRTPSPPGRVCTPPAPHYGSKYDSYEPYSPRRSTRIAHSRTQQGHSDDRLSREELVQSTPRKKPARAAFQGVSPPSSPISPVQRSAPRTARRARFAGDSDSDNHRTAPTPSRRNLGTAVTGGMLPTPAKTPRKRTLQQDEPLGHTGRVLFASRPASIDEIMPTPRKTRKTVPLSLESFERAEQTGGQIPIYTDSKERVPSVGHGDNPFLSTTPSTKRSSTRKALQSANHDEGITYIFRGKKVFRRYEDADGPSAPDLSGDEIRRKAGAEAHKPLTRSSVKPRLLFQEELKQRGRLALDDDADEDDVETEIELSVSTPSRRKVRKLDHETITTEHQESTATSSTTRRTRRKQPMR